MSYAKKAMAAVFIVALFVMISGCATNGKADSYSQYELEKLVDTEKIKDSGVYKFHDDECNVTCYVCVDSNRRAGYGTIYCIPDAELNGENGESYK